MNIKPLADRVVIKMTEAEARLQHGWITVTGADTVVANEGK